MAGVKGYTLKEAASRVGVSAATIVRWMDGKKVKVAMKRDPRGYYSFTEADLRKLIAYKKRTDGKQHSESL
jgi:predicted site-specific integrase-resolvase